MTSYLRTGVDIKLSDSSNYEFPTIVNPFVDYETTPTNWVFRDTSATLDAQKTIDLSEFSTITNLIVQNLDDTTSGTIRWVAPIGSAAYTVTFANSNPDSIADDGVAGTFGTNGALAGGLVRVSGSSGGLNDSTFLIQAVTTANLLTLAASESLTAGAADAVTLSFLQTNRVVIAPGQTLMLGATDPSTDMILRSDLGTINFRLFIEGT